MQNYNLAVVNTHCTLASSGSELIRAADSYYLASLLLFCLGTGVPRHSASINGGMESSKVNKCACAQLKPGGYAAGLGFQPLEVHKEEMHMQAYSKFYRMTLTVWEKAMSVRDRWGWG